MNENYLFTCGLDGAISSWTFQDDGNQNAIKYNRLVDHSTEGFFGLATSPNSLFLLALEK
jgi:hypothetical protein